MKKSNLVLGTFILLLVLNSCRTDDVKPYLSISSKITSVSDNSAKAVLYAKINTPINEDIEVLLTIGGTATEDVDFVLDKKNMVIYAGKLSDSILITTKPNALVEGNKTLEFTINSAKNAIPIANQTVTFTIVEEANLPDASKILLIEDFNYYVGDALTTYGWIAHSGGTTNPVSVTAPGLSFTGYAGSNFGLAAGVNNTGQDVNKQFTPQTTAGVSVYASYLVNATATSVAGDYFIHFFDPNATTAHRARTFISSQAGQMLVGLSFNAATPQTNMTTLLNFGQTYLFVMKYTIVDGALNDNVSLYVFAEGDNFKNEPSTPTIGPLTGTAVDIVPTGIALRQFDAAQRITVDGVRVKTVWQLTSDAVRQSVQKFE